MKPKAPRPGPPTPGCTLDNKVTLKQGVGWVPGITAEVVCVSLLPEPPQCREPQQGRGQVSSQASLRSQMLPCCACQWPVPNLPNSRPHAEPIVEAHSISPRAGGKPRHVAIWDHTQSTTETGPAPLPPPIPKLVFLHPSRSAEMGQNTLSFSLLSLQTHTLDTSNLSRPAKSPPEGTVL